MAFVVRGQEVKLGRISLGHCRAKLAVELYLERLALPAPKPSDWTTGITSWPMMGNNQFGCCVVAMLGHGVQIATKFGNGNMVVPSDEEVVNTYFALTGGRDVGLDITDTLDWFAKNGNALSGQAIDGWGTIDFRNTKMLAVACQLFGPLSCGVYLPDNFQNDLNNDTGPLAVWNDTRLPANRNNGHAIPIVGANNNGLLTITWGIKTLMTWQWFAKYAMETQVLLWEAWRGQLNPSQVDAAEFINDYRQITGQTPITPPVPPSPPSPTPGPTPHPVGDSVGLDAVIRLSDGRTGRLTVDKILVG